MTSKVQDMKDEMGYRKKGPSCGNCLHLSSALWIDRYANYGERRNRCKTGNFTIMKNAWCEKHEFKK